MVEEAWNRNFTTDGTDEFGRAILLVPFLDPTLAHNTNITASYAHGNYESAVFNLTKRFSNHYQVFANYAWSENKDNGASERDTDTYFGQQDPFNIGLITAVTAWTSSTSSSWVAFTSCRWALQSARR